MKVSLLYIALISAVFTPIIKLISDLTYNNFGLFLVIGIFIVLDTLMGVALAMKDKKANSEKFIEMFAIKFITYAAIILFGLGLYVASQSNEIYDITKETGKYIALYPIGFIFVKEAWSLADKFNKIYPGIGDAIKGLFKKFGNDKTS